MRWTTLASLFVCAFLSVLPNVFSQNVTISARPGNDAQVLAKVIKGSLIIDKDVVGSLSLTGIERVEGDIECLNGKLQNFSGESLISIGGSLRFHGITNLSMISLPNLLSVDILDLGDVPSLLLLELNHGLNNISEIHIANSGLKTFSAHPPRPGSVIEISDNPSLRNITFPFAQDEVGRPWVRITSPGSNANIDLGDIIHARFIVLKGFLNSILGLDNLQIVDKDFWIENKSNFDCGQFSQLRYGDFTCSAANSTIKTSALTAVGLATVRAKSTTFISGSVTSTGPVKPTKTDEAASETSVKPSTGLSTGAKAAIGILAAGLVAALVLLVYFILRYRKVVDTKQEDPEPQELPTGGHHEKTELPNDESVENLHRTKHTSPEDNPSELLSPAIFTGKAHELHTSASVRQYSEADSSPISRKEVPPPIVGTESYNLSKGSGSDADKKLDILKSRLEMVRSDKERLSKLQDLDQLEMDLKEQIMTEQRKVYK